MREGEQCSRLKPSCEFHFEGLSDFNPLVGRVGSYPRRQSKNIELEYETHFKLVHELYGYMFPVQCEEIRINHLTLLLLVVTVPYACWFWWQANDI